MNGPLVVDVSGSMYRFNGHDQRLERMLESTLMVMEALDGYGDRGKCNSCLHHSDFPFSFFGQCEKKTTKKICCPFCLFSV